MLLHFIPNYNWSKLYANRNIFDKLVTVILLRTSSTNVINSSKIDSTYPSTKDEDLTKSRGTKSSSLVASAFASLKENAVLKPLDITSLDEAILNASNPEELLSLTEKTPVNKRQAFKIVSILADWSVSRGTELSDFESDSRFVRICHMLGKQSTTELGSKFEDNLSVVLNVKNDDEAAQLINSCNLNQLIKVLSALALKKRRSTPLLRSLSANISQNNSKLNIKQAADILFALATLSFPDEVLLEKTCSQLVTLIPKCQKPSVIGSITTSLGVLRYKDPDLLDSICEWIKINSDICRPQEFVAICSTLASVNYIPRVDEYFIEDLKSHFINITVSQQILDIVWALAVLEKAKNDDLEKVLHNDFLLKLKNNYLGELPVSVKRKLLQINGLAKLDSSYKGPLLELNPDVTDIPFTRSKDKETLVMSVLDALSNLIPSSLYLKTNVNLDMGFIIDAECLMNAKLTPLPIIDRKTGEPITPSRKGYKIGFMIWDYHDHTKNKVELNGVSRLCIRLATLSGYKVLNVPYNIYNPQDKLVSRVKFLESKIKQLVNVR